MVHCVVMGLVYSAFSLIYWYLGGTNQFGEPFIYKVLNYGESPLKAMYYIIAISFIVAPMIHSMFFLLYRLRVFLHRFLKVMDKRHNMASDWSIQYPALTFVFPVILCQLCSYMYSEWTHVFCTFWCWYFLCFSLPLLNFMELCVSWSSQGSIYEYLCTVYVHLL